MLKAYRGRTSITSEIQCQSVECFEHGRSWAVNCYLQYCSSMAALDETQSTMLVTFYSALSCIYFPIIISALYLSDFLYHVGTSSFLPVIAVFVVMECIKYVVGNHYLINRHIVLGAKNEDRHFKKNKSRSKEFMKSCGVLFIALLSFFVLEILFGAEAFDKHEETYMLSVLLCALTIFPACLNVGPHAVLTMVKGARPTPDILGVLLVRNLQLTLLGAWLGAFVIPLDWDRPWQKWPVPCSLGALLGHTTSNLLMLLTMVPHVARTRPQAIKSSRRSC